MEATKTETLAELLAEQTGIGEKVERAAVEEDTVSWIEARMRADALPALIREARSAPLRARLARLDVEAERLVEERDRALVEEPPAAPAQMRGTVTPHMMRAQVLDGINRREGNVARERREVLAQIAAMEDGEGP